MNTTTTFKDICEGSRISVGAGWHALNRETIDLDLAAVTFDTDGSVRMTLVPRK